MIEIRRGFGPWRIESLNFEEKGRKYREQNRPFLQNNTYFNIILLNVSQPK